MSDRTSFLRAIRANPADDTPRLVFADWLDEHDEPGWAEFIRLQIELDPIRDQLDHPRVGELTEREAVLLGTHAHEWVGPAADVATGYPAFGPVFRRGMPEMVCFSLDAFLARGAELFAACPTVREVSLYDVADRGADLAACPHLANVETLEIADQVFVDIASPLYDALTRPGLRCLKFWWWHFDQGYCVENLARRWRWPESVSVIQLVRDLGDYAGQVAKEMNFIRGESRAAVSRPYDARFPLAQGMGHGFYPGINDEGDPVLLAVRPDRTGMWVFFDPDGRQTDAATFGAIAPDEVEAWRARRGGVIRVRPFEVGGLSLRLWPPSYLRDYLSALGRPPGTSDVWWRSRGGVLRRWLHEGRFVIEWDGREFTADATGKIIAT